MSTMEAARPHLITEPAGRKIRAGRRRLRDCVGHPRRLYLARRATDYGDKRFVE